MGQAGPPGFVPPQTPRMTAPMTGAPQPAPAVGASQQRPPTQASGPAGTVPAAAEAAGGPAQGGGRATHRGAGAPRPGGGGDALAAGMGALALGGGEQRGGRRRGALMFLEPVTRPSHITDKKGMVLGPRLLILDPRLLDPWFSTPYPWSGLLVRVVGQGP